jgi:hypothetical protein
LELEQQRDVMVKIINRIEEFDFEDRKVILTIIIELFGNCREVMIEVFYPDRHYIVESLLNKYTLDKVGSCVGQLIRLFTSSSVNQQR